MDGSAITIRFVDNWSTDELVTLYRNASWWRDWHDPAIVPPMVAGSFAFAVACTPEGRAVGTGRVLSDGVSDAYIQDVTVLPDYRGRGLGQRIVQALLDRCRQRGISWIGLVAKPGTAAFYEGLGFKRQEGYVFMLREEG
jgi:ribosomal protein S18 acetylase RimI-like enzyme